MAKTTTRIFAFVIAVLFLITTIGFSGVVVWTIFKDNKEAKKIQSDQTAADNLARKKEACTFSGQIEGQAKSLPQAFIPAGPVKELKTTDLKVGDGDQVDVDDCLLVKYHGTLAKDGIYFDGNFDKPALLRFLFGAGNVIKGWDQGLVGMRVGGLRRLEIPAELAYGSQAAGSVPANADLIFVVELVKIQD